MAVGLSRQCHKQMQTADMLTGRDFGCNEMLVGILTCAYSAVTTGSGVISVAAAAAGAFRPLQASWVYVRTIAANLMLSLIDK